MQSRKVRVTTQLLPASAIALGGKWLLSLVTQMCDSQQGWYTAKAEAGAAGPW